MKEDLVFRPNSEDPYARFRLHLIGAVAELERSLIRERQRERIEAAKARGVYTGRARVLTDEQAREAKALAIASGASNAATAEAEPPPEPTLYRYLAQTEETEHPSDTHPT